MKKSGLFLSVLFLSAVPQLAFAWGDLGHQIVGAIAEERIAPQTKDFVRGILGIEPIAVAANWPDHVRDDKRFGGTGVNDFAPFHFAEVPTGFTYDTRPNKDPKDAYGAVMGAVAMLTKPNGVSREKQMIALRYLIHIVGDIHQPLHVGNDFDRGGNACLVRYSYARAQTVNNSSCVINYTDGKPGVFHAFWDEDMVTDLGLSYLDPYKPCSKPLQYYPEYVTAMKKAAPTLFYSATPRFTEATVAPQVKSWIDQSAQLREKVYPDDLGGNPQAYKLRKYCLWYSDQSTETPGATSIQKMSAIANSDIPPVDQKYVAKFLKSIVEPQLITAGVRLAGLLDYVAATALKNDASANTVPDALQNQYIQEIQSQFFNQPE